MTATVPRPATETQIRDQAGPEARNKTGRRIISREIRSRVGLTLMYVALIAFTAFAIGPLLWMVSAAFKPADEVLQVPVNLIPSVWHPENFTEALFSPRFTGHTFAEFLWNSILVATITSIAAIGISIMVGYGFAKFRFKGRDALMWTILGSTLLPFASVLIPLYLIIQAMGLTNTLAALIIPFVVSGQALFISRQFILGIPDEYIEAARIDGLSEFGIFRKIILPLAGPAVTTVAVMTFLFSWNQFLWPLVVASSQENYTAPLGLSLLGLGGTFNTEYNIWMAAAVLAILPPLIFFLIMERPYLRGLEALSGIK